MPGVITWPGLGDGEAVGITMPGVITCGPGEDLGFLVVRFPVVRLTLGRGFFFLAALFGFGLFIPGILLMSCPCGILLMSCCGKTFRLTAQISATAPRARSALLQLLGLFMVPLFEIVNANSHKLFLNESGMDR